MSIIYRLQIYFLKFLWFLINLYYLFGLYLSQINMMEGQNCRKKDKNINKLLQCKDEGRTAKSNSKEKVYEKEKDSTDLIIRKNGNLKPLHPPNANSMKSIQPGDNLLNIRKLSQFFQKSQSQFNNISQMFRQMLQGQQKINGLIFQELKKTQLSKSEPYKPKQSEKDHIQLEERDNFFYLQIPYAMGESALPKLKKWLFKLVTNTFSVAFKNFSSKKMTFKQTKIYCSMNILYNLIKLIKQNKIEPITLQQLDKYLKEDLLIYLQKKYPLTQAPESNKNLQNIIQEIDNLGNLSNNYFSQSEIVFQYRQDGNYNDLIMRMVNDIVLKLDQQSQFYIERKMSNYLDFKTFMTNVFQIIEEDQQYQTFSEDIGPGIYEYVNNKINIKASSRINSEQANSQKLQKEKGNATERGGMMNFSKDSKVKQMQKQKQKASVQQYTSYSINRKIPENISLYTQKQIQSMNLTIKHPTICRILTKWCGQLRNKFSSSDYFLNYSDNIQIIHSDIVNNLLFPMRIALDDYLKKQSIEIKSFLNNLCQNNYEMQLNLLKKEISKFQYEQIDEYELQNICGRYSVEMMNNLYSCLIAYVNKLIHSIMKVSKKFHQNQQIALKHSSKWPSPPNLITFTIGDLMRCKITSKERQIIRIYQHIKQISIKSSEKIKILRIKNRLKTSTNDILINIKFNGMIICEIQLAVKAETSDFIKCSNSFCHYIYQLQRSPFGSISQLCSIWVYLDRRSETFKQLIQNEASKEKARRNHTCNENFKKISYSKPFICHICDIAYYHNNYLRSHIQCLTCKKIICVKCQLKVQNQNLIMQSLIANKNLRKSCDFMINRLQSSSQMMENQLPEFGLCIYIESRFPKIDIFRLIKYKNECFILGRKDGVIYEIQKVQSQKELVLFLRKYVIFKLNNNLNEYLKISLQEALQEYILPKLLYLSYKKQKESLVLGDKLNNDLLKNILKLGSNESRERITKLFLDHNEICEVSYIVQHFKNVKILELSNNPIRDLSGLDMLKSIKSLSLINCFLNVFPSTVYNLSSLEELCISHNLIITIDDNIQKLKNLKIFQISFNKLTIIPNQLAKCLQLVILRCQNNKISNVPFQLSKLNNLRSLYFNNNCLKTIPQQFGQLYSLETFDLSCNQIESTPLCLSQMAKLQHLHLTKNKITKFQDSAVSLLKSKNHLSNFSQLKYLDLFQNGNLSSLGQKFGDLKNLQSLILNRCNFTSIPQELSHLKRLFRLQICNNELINITKLQNITSLTELKLTHNKIQETQQSFLKLINLTQLHLNNNKLKTFPNLNSCQKLKIVNLSHNLITFVKDHHLIGLNNIQLFNLSYNQIEEITKYVVNLNKLIEFDVSHNKIKELGSNLQENREAIWPNLCFINLEHNQLEAVPDCLLKSEVIGNLEQLKVINISSNRVEKLPNEITSLKCLQKMKLAKNNIQRFTKEVYKFMLDVAVDIDVNNMASIEEQSPMRKRLQSKKSNRKEETK